jgi:hypothetical protein
VRIRSQKWHEAASSIKAAHERAATRPPAVTNEVLHIAELALGATAVAAEIAAGGFLVHAAASQIGSLGQVAIAGASFAAGYLGLEALWGAGHAFLDQARPSAFPRLEKGLLASQRHHLTPRDVTEAGVFDHTAPFAVLFTPVLAGLAYIDPSYAISSAVLGFALGATITLDVHRFNHLAKQQRPWPLKLSSFLGLTQKPSSHWVHHDKDDQNVCQLTDYVNPLFNRLKVYERIGNALRRRGLHVEQDPGAVLAPRAAVG